jgi:hypothetical protein
MDPVSNDPRIYTPENVLRQAETAELVLGYKKLTFYVDEHGLLARMATPQTAEFFLSPSGGTLRDSEMNIVAYSAKYDLYKGYGRL